MANIASALTRLDAAQQAKRPDACSSPPTRPATPPAALRAYLDRFDPSFDGLTGDLPTIVELGKAFDVAIDEGPEGSRAAATTSRTAPRSSAAPRDGRAPFVWTAGTDRADLAARHHHAPRRQGARP